MITPYDAVLFIIYSAAVFGMGYWGGYDSKKRKDKKK